MLENMQKSKINLLVIDVSVLSLVSKCVRKQVCDIIDELQGWK